MNGSKSTPPAIPASQSHYILDYVWTHGRKAGKSFHCEEDDLHCRLCGMNFEQNNDQHQAHLNFHRKESIIFIKKSGNEKVEVEGIDGEILKTFEDSDTDETEEESTYLVLKQKTKTGNLKLTLRNARITSSVVVMVQNNSIHSIQLTDVFLFNNDVAVPLLDIPVLLVPGEMLDFTLINLSFHSGNVNDYVLRYFLLPVKTELIEVHRLDRCCNTRRTLNSKFLSGYHIPENMEDLVKELKKRAVVPCQLKPKNYVETFTQFIQLEEYYRTLELEGFNFDITLTNTILTPLMMPQSYSITIPNVVPKFPLLKKYDQFWMKPKGSETNPRKWVLAAVTDILPSKIHVFVTTLSKPTADKTYKIEFILNRLPFQMERRALDIMQRFNLITFMFPEPVPEFSDHENRSHIQELQWFNDDIKNNPEQRQAVLGIINGVSYPAPYLIFGPPGTGKTATITEAICQLLLTQPHSRILVTATSNAAADEVTLRLLKYLRNACYFDHNVYRLYAANVLREVTDPQLLANSNYTLHSLPGWAMLSKYRVIISTLVTSGRLMLKPPFSTEAHFSHLFVDECGSATESAALIPIAICSSPGRINANVILAGDPKQLGPVVISETAEKMGHGESLIARLMNRDAYQRNTVTNAYCSRMLTQLLKNFRSHPDIINISNDLFYNSQLQPCASKEKTHCYLGWWKLPAKNVPILFDVTEGFAKKDEYSHSWFNNEELKRVIHYVQLLMRYGINGNRISEDDIGIISPYKRQCQRIEMELKDRNYNIMTASVELFQGKEKPIIIISTVRSGQQGIGFLNNPKRLNVLLTRAQSLMIFIGNPNVLQKDRNWYAVLERLTMLQVIIGSRFVLAAERPALSSEGISSGNGRNMSDEDIISSAVGASRLI